MENEKLILNTEELEKKAKEFLQLLEKLKEDKENENIETH